MDFFGPTENELASLVERTVDISVGASWNERQPVSDPFAAVVAACTDPAYLDRLVQAIGLNRIEKALKGRPTLDPFPDEPGTVELTVWDNQPFGKGHGGRDRPARYAVTLTAFRKGFKSPISAKVKHFEANVGDLFTADEIDERMKDQWRGMDADEAAFVGSQVLGLARNVDGLVARLQLTKQGGRHFHAYHYVVIPAAEIEARDVQTIGLISRSEGGLFRLPPASTLDCEGNAFQMVTRTTKTGAVKRSIVIAQSRATDLTSDKMTRWATGPIVRL